MAEMGLSVTEGVSVSVGADKDAKALVSSTSDKKKAMHFSFRRAYGQPTAAPQLVRIQKRRWKSMKSEVKEVLEGRCALLGESLRGSLPPGLSYVFPSRSGGLLPSTSHQLSMVLRGF